MLKVNLPQEELNRIINSIISVVPTHSIYIFGSYARGEETKDSDIDIYVLTNKDNDKIDYNAMTDADLSLWWLRKARDIICLSKKEFDKRAKRKVGLERIVAKEGVKVYG